MKFEAVFSLDCRIIIKSALELILRFSAGWVVDALRARVVAENEIEPVVGEDRRVTKVHLNASSLSLFCNDAHCQGAPVGYFGGTTFGFSILRYSIYRY